ncbi:prefoldin subunit 3 [Sarcoptes scabiei]|nr:prefoldin subunit 3 [Sarcoptes scabiei]
MMRLYRSSSFDSLTSSASSPMMISSLNQSNTIVRNDRDDQQSITERRQQTLRLFENRLKINQDFLIKPINENDFDCCDDDDIFISDGILAESSDTTIPLIRSNQSSLTPNNGYLNQSAHYRYDRTYCGKSMIDQTTQFSAAISLNFAILQNLGTNFYFQQIN